VQELQYEEGKLLIHALDIHGSDLDIFKIADFAVLPLGSYEYHGPSSPYGTDQLLAESFANLIESDLNGIIYPCIPYSLCPGKTSRYPGTISIRAEVALTYISEVCKEISKSGIKNIILLNAHDANMSLARTAAESITNDDHEVNFLLLNWWQMVDMNQAEEIGFVGTKGRGHGGPYEMSAVKFFKPDWIPTILGEEYVEPPKYSDKAYVEIEAFPKQWDGYTGLLNQISFEAGEKIVTIATENMNELIHNWVSDRKEHK
jgi:creatinine amidohydrolase